MNNNLWLQDLKLVDKSFLPISGLGPLLEMNHPFMSLQTGLRVLSVTRLLLKWKYFVTAMEVAILVHQEESGFITRVTGAWCIFIYTLNRNLHFL